MRGDESATGATGGAPADSGNEPPADATTGGRSGTGGDAAGTGGDGSPERPADAGPTEPIVEDPSCPPVMVQIFAPDVGRKPAWRDLELRGCCRSDGWCGSAVASPYPGVASFLPASGCRAHSELDAQYMRTTSSAVLVSCGGDAADAATRADASIAPDASDAPDGAPLETSLWNGVDLSEWEGDPSVWRVEDGAIVARAPNGAISTNTFLIHRGRAFGNFALRAQIWLGAQGNSGIQYRSARLNAVDFRMTGYQADLGAGYWGALYEELGRGILAAASDPCVAAGRFGEWLDYEILAQGPSIVHRLGGVECVTYDETAAGRPTEGAIGLQYHVPGGFDVRFRALTVRELSP
jgi:hypothetical protein